MSHGNKTEQQSNQPLTTSDKEKKDPLFYSENRPVPAGSPPKKIFLQRGKLVMSSYCMHGSGKGNTDAKPKFSNELNSGCSSLGRYVMVGKGRGRIKNSIRLRGFDKTNNLAEARGILIHSAGKVTRFQGEADYISIGMESLGCFTVSRGCHKQSEEDL